MKLHSHTTFHVHMCRCVCMTLEIRSEASRFSISFKKPLGKCNEYVQAYIMLLCMHISHNTECWKP